jgi:hypothetical protein
MVIRKIGNPIAEKGMHTRSQQQLSGGMAASATQNIRGCGVGGRVRMPLSDARRNLFRRSGMGTSFPDAHPRRVAVALRQRAALLP